MTTANSFGCLEDILLCSVATTYCTDPPFPTASTKPGPDHGPDHGPDQGPNHGPDQGPDYGPDHGPDHGPDRGPDHESDQGKNFKIQNLILKIRN